MQKFEEFLPDSTCDNEKGPSLDICRVLKRDADRTNLLLWHEQRFGNNLV